MQMASVVKSGPEKLEGMGTLRMAGLKGIRKVDAAAAGEVR